MTAVTSSPSKRTTVLTTTVACLVGCAACGIAW
jgi:hypothetical protein